MMKEPEKIFLEYVLSKEEGDIILHEEIEDMMLIKAKIPKYYTFIRKIDKELLNYNKSLRAIKGIGYRVLGGEAIIDKAIKLIKKSEERTYDAANMIANIDPHKLDLEYQKKFELVKVKFIQLHSNLAGGVTEILLLDNDTKKRREIYGGMNK